MFAPKLPEILSDFLPASSKGRAVSWGSDLYLQFSLQKALSREAWHSTQCH